jgi:putative tryptophan/tyrosine transport system substrate-binding protein
VIVAFGTKAVLAAERATTTIPIVDPIMGDPIALGLSASLARPGRNITGSAQFGRESAAKRLGFSRKPFHASRGLRSSSIPSILRGGKRST